MEKYFEWIILDVNRLHKKYNLSLFLEGINKTHLLLKKENILNRVAVLIEKNKINYIINCKDTNRTSMFFRDKDTSRYIRQSVCLYVNKNSSTCDINLDDMRAGVDIKCIECVSNEIPAKSIRIGCDIPRTDIHNFFKKIKMLVVAGFTNPVLVRNGKNTIIMHHTKGEGGVNQRHTINECIDLVLCSKKKENSMYIKLEKNSIDILKNTPFSKCTLNVNKSCTQKEMAGALNVVSVNESGIYIIGIDRKSVIYGTEEGVKIVNGKYNFHSHPEEAYIKYKVKDGIPSAQDYIGYITSVYKNNSRCHFVAAIEGVYIISMSKDFIFHSDIKNIIDGKKSKPKLFKFIKTKYSENRIKYTKVSEYIKIINAIKYSGRSIFEVKFYRWNYLGEKHIKIYYLAPEINLYE